MAKRLPVIGLTGGIGSGKSTVSQLLAERGARIINADTVGHQIYQPGTEAWQEIVQAFGREVLNPDGTINRARLGEKVFSDPQALARLNAITHPRIYAAIEEQIRAIRADPPPGIRGIVVEAALLIEAGWTPLVDQIWVVVASEEKVIERVMQQRSLSREEIQRRIAAQLDSAERQRYADLVLVNDGSLEELKATVEKHWTALTQA
ncbi:MAG: dephospho-CoA kinase [Nitrospinota bacterium]|nr:MAG: dephospho-CoA kinase [Nitrospinota bacterium]